MQVRAYITSGEVLSLMAGMTSDERAIVKHDKAKGMRYINVDYLTLMTGGKDLEEDIKSRIAEVTISNHFLTANIIDLGLYEEELGNALVEQDIASGDGIPKVVFGLAYLSWGSKTLEEALNLYNAIRSGSLKPAEGKNWGSSIPGLNPREEEFPGIDGEEVEDSADTMLPE